MKSLAAKVSVGRGIAEPSMCLTGSNAEILLERQNQMNDRVYSITNEAPPVSPFLRRGRRLLQNHNTLLHALQIALSILCSVVVLQAFAWWENGEIHSEYRSMAITSGLLMLVIYEWRGVFRRFDGGILRRLSLSWSLVAAMVVSIIFISNNSAAYSPKVVIEWYLFGFFAQIFGYYISYRLTQKLRLHYGQPIRAVVLGSARLAEHLVSSINKNAWIPDVIIGVIDDSQSQMSAWADQKVKHLGSIRDVVEIIEKHKINRVYLALPASCSQITERVYRDIAGASIDVVWVPDIFSMQLLNHSIRELNGLPLITLSESPMMSETQLFCKTIIDKVIAILALILLSPLFALIAWLVYRSSPGPVIYRQKRHGWDGKVIEVCKFRSMYVSDENSVQQASKNDPRITPIGQFIRRTSIDELPQLLNVLNGSMSLVGPRPHAIEHNGFYTQYIRSYMMRHRIKPGMTGLAQICGYRGETEKLEKMLARVKKDIEYINNWSLSLDLKILAKTPFSLLSKNAY